MTLIKIWTALFSVISCLPWLAKVSRSLCLFAVCAVFLVTQASAAQGDVRLVNGPNPYEGRVEYYNNGVWLSLCGTSVDGYVYMVICRQLGYPAAGAMMFYGPSYGTAPGEIYRGKIYCSADEASLSGCTFTNQDVNCDPVYTLGVSCDTNITVSKKVRLRGGANPYEGRLEIFLNGIWGTVARNSGLGFYLIDDQINAHVACRELFGQGYGGSYFPASETPSRFGILQSGAIHFYHLLCNGDEHNLLDCLSFGAGIPGDRASDITLKCYPVPQGCGDYFKSSSGTFQSPVYPAGMTFGQDTHCVWRIFVTNPCRVRLSVTVIETDELARDFNYLDVTNFYSYSGITSTRGSNISSVVSNDNVMHVRLTTAKNSTGIKFTASWERTVCEQNFTSTAQYIQSPGYGDAYLPNLDCRYFIQQRAEFKVRIQFNWFQLYEKDNGNCSEFLTVYDGDSESAPILGGPYCGNTKPPVLTSTQNVVMIKFHLEGNANGTSLKFTFDYTGQEPDCPQGTYGINCANICNCSSGADRCDVITGCVCKTGWAGDACGADVNECMTSTSQEACQRKNAECSNLLGGYKCVCRNGFAMDNDSNCQECSEGTYGMSCNQTCSCLGVNVESCDKVSGTCHCKAGWEGDLCDIDINGSACDAGYSRNQKGVCVECMPGKFGLNCAETCTCRSNSAASCDKVNGTCSCKAGWEGRNCDLDIDECSSSANNCSANYLTVCENTPGSFTCACKSGYGKNKNGVCIASCTAGHFINADDNGRCTLCPVGRYQELANQNVCNKCPAGSTTNTTGTRDIQACRAPPEVKNTASVQLLYVLLHICTREDEVKTSSEVHARIVFMQSDWTGLCNDSACGNAHVTSSCEGPTSKIITSVIAFEEIAPTLTSSDTNTTLPTNEVFLQAILQRNIFDLQTTTGAVLSKNDVSVMMTWSCKAGYVPSGDTCVAAPGGGISPELIGSIVGGCIGLIAVVLLVVLAIRQCRTPRTQRQVDRPTPEHPYDSLTPSAVERPHTGWNSPPPPHSSHWPDTLAPKPTSSVWIPESSIQPETPPYYDYLELEDATKDIYLTPVGITATLQEMTSNPDHEMTSKPDLPSRTGVTPLYDRSRRGGLGSNDTALQIVTATPRDPTPTAHEPAADYD